MAHTCEDCGEEFETLTERRLHDCPADEKSEMEAALAESAAERRRDREKEERAARRDAPQALTDALDRASAGDPDAVHQLLASYERALREEAMAEDGDYWPLQRAFYEQAAAALLAVTDQEGWAFLCDVLDAYWPETTLPFEEYPGLPPRGRDQRHDSRAAFPHVSHVLANAAGRRVVRTRRTEGVAAIPADVLDYLLQFHRDPGDAGPWTASMTYGWGIGHPDHPVADSLVTLVSGSYDIWAGSALEHALHADQHAAVDVFEEIFETVEVYDPHFLFRALASIAKQRYPTEPEFFDWEAVYPEFGAEGFDWDPDARERIRAVVDQSGVMAHRQNWTFADLEV